MNGLLDLGAATLARLIAGRQVSPVELVDAHVARIEAVNGLLNAVVATRFEAAREEARAAEARAVRGGELPPLLGVPCTVKEFIGVAGMPQTAGIVYRWGARAAADATAVARLRAAGAIVLGVTNAPEGGLWMETNNLVYGRSANPWDLSRTPGGSSGGEAAIIAAGGSPFGLGSDVGGSVRIPAAFCGICSHKPTGRMVPSTGHWPPVSGDMGAYNCIGPMARRVGDLDLALRVIAGPDGSDPSTRAFELGPREGVDLASVSVYPVTAFGRVRPSREVGDAVERAVSALAARGARRHALTEPRLRDVFNIWSALLASAAGESYATLLGDGKAIPVMREVLRFPFGRSNHTTPALALVVLETLQRQLPGRVRTYVEAGRALQAALEQELGPDGVIVAPPYTRAAPRHRASMLTPFDFVCTALFNAMEFPVTVVPVGFDAEGMPLAVQVAAIRGRDHVALAAAAAIEATLGGWTRAEPSADEPVERAGTEAVDVERS